MTVSPREIRPGDVLVDDSGRHFATVHTVRRRRGVWVTTDFMPVSYPRGTDARIARYL